MKRSTKSIYYKVNLGGSMYQEYESKPEALEMAIKASVGKEPEDYTTIYRIERLSIYDERIGKEILIEKRTTETLAMLVVGRKSMEAKGGYTDYEE